MENEKNSRFNKEKFQRLFARYGSYVVVGVCIVIVIVASLIVLPKQENKKQTQQLQAGGKNETQNEAHQAGVSIDEAINDILNPETGRPYSESGKRYPATKPVSDFTQKEDEKEQAGQNTSELLNPPVTGEIIWAYAMDELIYSKTLNQWTTHCGTDLACKLGDSVRAVANGTVASVYKDDAFGVTVIVEHENGHKSVYSNLADNPKVKAGDKVKANDILGVCGNTSVLECGDRSHIHFEYYVDDKPVNPEKYVRLQKS